MLLFQLLWNLSNLILIDPFSRYGIIVIEFGGYFQSSSHMICVTGENQNCWSLPRPIITYFALLPLFIFFKLPKFSLEESIFRNSDRPIDVPILGAGTAVSCIEARMRKIPDKL